MSVIWTSVALLEIPGGSGVRSLDLTTHTSLSPIRRGFKPGFGNYRKGHIRLAVACDKVYQLLAHAYGRWFSPDNFYFMLIYQGRIQDFKLGGRT